MKNSSLSFQVGEDTVFSRFEISRIPRSRYEWQTNRHCNPDYELHLILRGKGIAEVEYDRVELSAQGILISPGAYHQTRVLPEAFERFTFCFYLSEGRLLDSLQRQYPCYGVFSLTSELVELCRNFYYEYEANNLFSKDMQSLLLKEILIKSFRRLRLENFQRSLPEKEGAVEGTTMIDTFFETRFSEYITQDTLAQLLHISTRQLSRVLKNNYGMSFQEKLIATRMDHAAYLLFTTKKKIGEIVGLVGYTSESSFFKQFYRHFHMTPQQYRKRYEKKRNSGFFIEEQDENR